MWNTSVSSSPRRRNSPRSCRTPRSRGRISASVAGSGACARSSDRLCCRRIRPGGQPMNVKPKTDNATPLDDKRSHVVRANDLPWEKARFPGCETKTLLFDAKSGLATVLMRMAPGAKLPDHEHVLIEQTYVLEGSLVCGEGECKAGDYVWRPAGSRHEAWAGPQGVLLLGMFQMPNRFYTKDGRTTDFLGNDWDETWGK